MSENRDSKQQQSQQSTGTAEHMNSDRTAQQNQSTTLSDDEKHNIASQIGEAQNKVADIADTGALSGRDDASGGTGERMETQNSGQPTDR